MNPQEQFEEVMPDSHQLLVSDGAWPRYDPEVFETQLRVPYLQEPGVALIAKPKVNPDVLLDFLDGFDPELQFDDYLQDSFDDLAPAEQLVKVMGQLCYMSFGPKRTMNSDAAGYFDNIYSSGHGSVLEHANFSFVFYGISRSLTHELVRHRAGFAFSQVSQRYVDGSKLRFVERPEFVNNPKLHAQFEREIERVSSWYDRLAEELLASPQLKELQGTLSRTDLRKRVNQVARTVLPNCTEAPIGVTANVRAWHHFFNMRGSIHAETEIRRLAVRVFQCLSLTAPKLFSDIQIVTLQDGTSGLQVGYPKV